MATAGVVFFLNHYYCKWLGFLLLIRRGTKLAGPAGPSSGKPQACFPLGLADLGPRVIWGLPAPHTCFLWALRESSCPLPLEHPTAEPAWV